MRGAGPRRRAVDGGDRGDAHRGGAARARASTRTACAAASSSCWRTRSSDSTRLRAAFPALAEVEPAILAQLERDARYAPYLARQAAGRGATAARRGASAAGGLDYAAMPGLSNELRAKLGAGPAATPWPGRADRGHDAGGADPDPDARPARSSRARRGVMTAARRLSPPPSMFHVKQWTRLTSLPRSAARSGTRGSTWSRRASLADAWHRHFADSAQLWPLRPPGARLWLDLGSGAGFPGLVIAALAPSRRPTSRASGRERPAQGGVPRSRRPRGRGVPVTSVASRIEALPPQAADVVSARALAPLPTCSRMRKNIAGRGYLACSPRAGRCIRRSRAPRGTGVSTTDSTPAGPIPRRRSWKSERSTRA